jgi:hypothetical protein
MSDDQQQYIKEEHTGDDEPLLQEIEEIIEQHVPLWFVALGGIIVAILVLLPNFCVGKRNIKND